MGMRLIWLIKCPTVVFYECGEEIVNYLKEYWVLGHEFVHFGQHRFHFRALVNGTLWLHKSGEGSLLTRCVTTGFRRIKCPATSP